MDVPGYSGKKIACDQLYGSSSLSSPKTSPPLHNSEPVKVDVLRYSEQKVACGGLYGSSSSSSRKSSTFFQEFMHVKAEESELMALQKKIGGDAKQPPTESHESWLDPERRVWISSENILSRSLQIPAIDENGKTVEIELSARETSLLSTIEILELSSGISTTELKKLIPQMSLARLSLGSGILKYPKLLIDKLKKPGMWRKRNTHQSLRVSSSDLEPKISSPTNLPKTTHIVVSEFKTASDNIQCLHLKASEIISNVLVAGTSCEVSIGIDQIISRQTIERFQKLKVLILTDCVLDELPPVGDHLANLKIHRCQGRGGSHRGIWRFSQFSSLKMISISDCIAPLQFKPQDSKADQLEILELAYHNVWTFEDPKEVGDKVFDRFPSNLKVFRLRGASITQATTAKLPGKLEELLLEECPLAPTYEELADQFLDCVIEEVRQDPISRQALLCKRHETSMKEQR